MVYNSSNTQVKPHLAAFLRGEMDDLLLSLDTWSSRVTWTRLGNWRLCKSKNETNNNGINTIRKLLPLLEKILPDSSFIYILLPQA